MNTILKSIILSTLSATLLTDCLDSNNSDRTETKLGEDGLLGNEGPRGGIKGDSGDEGNRLTDYQLLSVRSR